ncbi:TBC1 domain family member 17-like isoform X2 [Chroicocephalus ridibundus]|uniref:TBC1 domain family member 17-like isoform X2 n=1 Tax=Chroicocephalus ridibundus TaxID=1192867 RepID=UPI002FDCF4D6
MEVAAGGRVLLELPGVSIPTGLHPAPPREGLLQGRLRVLQGPKDVVLEWEPLEELWDPPDDAPPPEEEPPDPGFEPDWAVLSPPRAPPRPPGWRGGFRLELGEVGGLRRSPPGLHRPFLVLLPRGGPCPPPLHFPRGGPRKLLRLLGTRLRPSPRDPRLLLVTPPEGPDPPPQPPSPGLVTRLLQGPYAATLGGLSRLVGGGRGHAPPPCARGAEPELEPEPPFEVRLGPRPSPPRGPPVTSEEWGRSHDAEGRSLDPEGLRQRLFRGGLSPEVRPEGWRRLLGLLPWGGAASDPPERDWRADYFRMKLQWVSLSPGQQRRNSPFRRYRRRLERDLARCHPHAPAAERRLLRDVLLTHCMFHFDLGYVRGMSEVLGPLLSVAPDEVEAFWGFSRLMELVGSNFGPGREGLKRQLGQLGQLVRVVDPELYPRLEAEGTRGCCRRWLQLRFQPPLGLQGTLRLWEVLWTGLPCPNFHLLLVCALLEMAGDGGDVGDIGDTGDVGDTGDIGDIGDIGDTGEDWDTDSDEDSDDWDEPPPGRRPALEAGEVLTRAEGLFLQLAAAPDLPPALQELLGLGGPPPSPPPGPPPELPQPPSAGDPPPAP